ncbi:MAG TPA: enoyl-CoA hydratase/isomerase family protein [Sphingobium sp.]|uniref:enoyl-CoA hydratase/isomerase family protein n=1 Tax=Sphingobium sp. TaxID=1912891 RepID=UPI002ED4B31F
METVDFRALFIDPLTLAAGWNGDPCPFLLVDLAALPMDMAGLQLPPCPLIGVGNSAHPMASRVDLRVETPATLEGLATSIAANPTAAAVLVQLLRGIEGRPPEAALVQESMAYGLLQGGAAHAAWLAARVPGEPVSPGELHMERVGDRLDLLLDRPVARNAIDRAMRDALHEAFTLVALDGSIEAVTLRGAGKAFSVGADLDEFGTTRDPAEAHAIRMTTLPAHAIVRCRDRLSVHVQGACVGAGLEMAAFATRLTATPDSWFQLPELAMGLLPGAGGCVSVSRRIGRQRAALMILSGKRISASTALSWGLIDAIVEEG